MRKIKNASYNIFKSPCIIMGPQNNDSLTDSTRTRHYRRIKIRTCLLTSNQNQIWERGIIDEATCTIFSKIRCSLAQSIHLKWANYNWRHAASKDCPPEDSYPIQTSSRGSIRRVKLSLKPYPRREIIDSGLPHV